MKKFFFLSIIFAGLSCPAFFSCDSHIQSPEKKIAQQLINKVDEFLTVNDQLLQAVNNNAGEQELQKKFLELRMAYKKIEWAAEYFEPVVSRTVNGPPVEEVEISDGYVSPPSGLQVMETYLFPKYDSTHKQQVITQIKLLPGKCEKYKVYFNGIDLLDWQVLDAVKLEVFRVITLGITGFDCPLAQNSMPEAAIAMESIKDVIHLYPHSDSTATNISAAIAYLRNNTDFNSFDRAKFITAYANPVTVSITHLNEEMHLQPLKYNRLLRQDAPTLFAEHAINADAYVPDMWALATGEKTALGEKLFSDPILSGDSTRSCSSCHQPEKFFTDGLDKNMSVRGDKQLRRNTPTLINAALQPLQFYDLRATTLEAQALNVVHNKDEMRGSMTRTAEKLWKDPAYQRLFAAAFPKSGKNGIDTLEIMNVLASYERSLVLLNSRFDDYMRGNATAMSQEEIDGFNLFMGKAKCATCHYMPLFNGTLPPRYVNIESEVIGVPVSINDEAIDTDMGTYNIVHTASLKHAFKTPTLRNASKTAPYMHNGVFPTLEQVVDFYNKGGGSGSGLHVANQTLPTDKLNLTKKEGDAIIAFIKSLDSRL